MVYGELHVALAVELVVKTGYFEATSDVLVGFLITSVTADQTYR